MTISLQKRASPAVAPGQHTLIDKMVTLATKTKIAVLCLKLSTVVTIFDLTLMYYGNKPIILSDYISIFNCWFGMEDDTEEEWTDVLSGCTVLSLCPSIEDADQGLVP